MSSLGRRIAPPRFLLFLAIFAAVGLAVFAAGSMVAPRMLSWHHSLMIGFDVAAAVFLLSVTPLFGVRDPDIIRRHCGENDANRSMLLVISGAVMVAILTAVTAEVTGDKPEWIWKVVIVVTLALAWLFSNTIYALHYAHVFYSEGHPGHQGLLFPDTKTPDYADMFYFAFTIGVTGATSDVNIASAHLRKLTMIHGVLAFAYNIGVIAFTINVLGSSPG